MFDQTFFSPQVRQCVIITYKRGIYKMPPAWPNDLRPTIVFIIFLRLFDGLPSFPFTISEAMRGCHP